MLQPCLCELLELLKVFRFFSAISIHCTAGLIWLINKIKKKIKKMHGYIMVDSHLYCFQRNIRNICSRHIRQMYRNVKYFFLLKIDKVLWFNPVSVNCWRYRCVDTVQTGWCFSTGINALRGGWLGWGEDGYYALKCPSVWSPDNVLRF